ncbi:MAG: AgmX/PglI C-terminal domain-containing protein [Polyangiaceae bacterium]|nr:AgmX/PglI C-terminal domain-containing protein [Polyangiaceae bacterium]
MATHSINPFASFSTVDVAESYALVPTTPKVSDVEVEELHAEAVEITIAWGSNVLAVKHLSPPRPFTIGDGADFVAPVELLGASRVQVVSCDGGTVRVVVPAKAEGTVSAENRAAQSIGELVAQGFGRASANGAREFDLSAGTSASFDLGELTVTVAAVRAGKRVEKGLLTGLAASAYQHTGLSFLLHGAIIGSLAFFMPSMGQDDAEGMDRDQLLMMQKMLNASAERNNEPLPQDSAAPAEAPGGAGTRAVGEEGKMGKAQASTNGRWQKEGPRDNANPQLSRAELKSMAADFGMNGLLASMSLSDPNAPTAAWAPPDGRGRDAQSFNGAMWANDIGDAVGAGGLGLFGTGENGGGKGFGVGLGDVGTIGHGQGTCTTGDCQGFGPGGKGGWGRGGNHVTGDHQVSKISMRVPVTTGNGHIPPEVIQRIVRANYGRFRACYESGLRTNPSLTGRVSVRFVIGREGAVSTSQDGGSDLPDQAVTSCVVRSFGNLSFPQPEGGIVTVNYPIVFSPGE